VTLPSLLAQNSPDPTGRDLTDISAALSQSAHAIDATLDGLLPQPAQSPEDALFEAMRYAVMAGGKRFRPILTLACARLFDVPDPQALHTGAAIELVHCYSLIHDDLPAMDNDDLRRGQPSCHAKFGEATAILAGDALMTLAFEVLASPETHPDAALRCALIAGLARASGAQGMVAGQMVDLAAEGKTQGPRTLDAAGIARMEGLKTGGLIAFSCEAAAMLGRASEPAVAALAGYARALGLAYQVVDDLLDAEGEADLIGKTAGKDARAGKATFVAALGLEGARAEAKRLAAEAGRHLDFFGKKADFLRKMMRFVIERHR
jgi:farnesyl diphosphate synthase